MWPLMRVIYNNANISCGIRAAQQPKIYAQTCLHNHYFAPMNLQALQFVNKIAAR
jgi:hypothetical protein